MRKTVRKIERTNFSAMLVFKLRNYIFMWIKYDNVNLSFLKESLMELNWLEKKLNWNTDDLVITHWFRG